MTNSLGEAEWSGLGSNVLRTRWFGVADVPLYMARVKQKVTAAALKI
jgi:hypothetical protein